MKVEPPHHFMGEPIPEDAIEKALAAEKKKKDGERENEEKGTQGKAQGEAPSLEGFIYVPSIKLHFAKERSLLHHLVLVYLRSDLAVRLSLFPPKFSAHANTLDLLVLHFLEEDLVLGNYLTNALS